LFVESDATPVPTATRGHFAVVARETSAAEYQQNQCCSKRNSRPRVKSTKWPFAAKCRRRQLFPDFLASGHWVAA
jgi:hypothetical protein